MPARSGYVQLNDRSESLDQYQESTGGFGEPTSETISPTSQAQSPQLTVLSYRRGNLKDAFRKIERSGNPDHQYSFWAISSTDQKTVQAQRTSIKGALEKIGMKDNEMSWPLADTILNYLYSGKHKEDVKSALHHINAREFAKDIGKNVKERSSRFNKFYNAVNTVGEFYDNSKEIQQRISNVQSMMLSRLDKHMICPRGSRSYKWILLDKAKAAPDIYRP